MWLVAVGVVISFLIAYVIPWIGDLKERNQQISQTIAQKGLSAKQERDNNG